MVRLLVCLCMYNKLVNIMIITVRLWCPGDERRIQDRRFSVRVPFREKFSYNVHISPCPVFITAWLCLFKSRYMITFRNHYSSQVNLNCKSLYLKQLKINKPNKRIMMTLVWSLFKWRSALMVKIVQFW